MDNREIMNLEEEMQAFIDETNKHDLHVLIEELQRNHFPNVLSKAKGYREKYQENKSLVTILWKVSAISHAEIGEYRQAAEIITNLYYEQTDTSIDELMVLGQLAFICDYKLSRRIMTDAVKKAEAEKDKNVEVLSSIYMILGEAEEHLGKLKRSLKYYKQSLHYFEGQEQDGSESYIKLFLAFKIGMLYTTLKEHESALEYLKQSIEYADGSAPEIKINSLVGIGQIYGELDRGGEGYPYLQEALRILPASTLRNSPVHTEALLETGYYHYQQGEYEKGVSLYEEVIQVYTASKNTTARKLGMMYMQYAYCLANQQEPQQKLAGTYYEKAIVQLEEENDIELLHSALTDVINFFEETGNTQQQRYFEKRMLALAEEAK